MTETVPDGAVVRAVAPADRIPHCMRSSVPVLALTRRRRSSRGTRLRPLVILDPGSRAVEQACDAPRCRRRRPRNGPRSRGQPCRRCDDPIRPTASSRRKAVASAPGSRPHRPTRRSGALHLRAEDIRPPELECLLSAVRPRRARGGRRPDTAGSSPELRSTSLGAA